MLQETHTHRKEARAGPVLLFEIPGLGRAVENARSTEKWKFGRSLNSEETQTVAKVCSLVKYVGVVGELLPWCWTVRCVGR